jgi:hypothetical protein
MLSVEELAPHLAIHDAAPSNVGLSGINFPIARTAGTEDPWQLEEMM